MMPVIVGTATLYLADCIEAMRTMLDNSVDSVVTDPPYHLTNPSGGPSNAGDTPQSRAQAGANSTGFMGKAWDGGNIAQRVELWAEVARVLKPGGHLLAFGGARTYHRMVCAIEDAGFEIRDRVLSLNGSGQVEEHFPVWIFGSGFPKAEIWTKAKADKGQAESAKMLEAGYEGWARGGLKPAHEPICVARKPLGSLPMNVLQNVELKLRERGVSEEIVWKPEPVSGAGKSNNRTISSKISQPASAVEQSVNHVAESGMLSVEPKTLSSFDQPGTNGLKITPDGSSSYPESTIDGYASRSSPLTEGYANAAENQSTTFSPSTTSAAAEMPTEGRSTEKSTLNSAEKGFRKDIDCFAGIATGLTGSMAHVLIKRDDKGFFLWPQGLPKSLGGGALSVAENVLLHGVGALNIDACRVHADDALGGAYTVKRLKPGATLNETGGNWRPEEAGAELYHGQMAPGRFPANVIHDGSPEVVAMFPAEAGQQAALKTCNSDKTRNAFGDFAGSPDANFAPHDARGSAARFFYCPKASRADRNSGLFIGAAPVVASGATMRDCETADWTARNGNSHPTVKPTDLMAYLCRLVTPPGGVVLDPFMGSGSTGKACMREGFHFVGCELEPEYLAIAAARIGYEHGLAEAANAPPAPMPQLDLFAEPQEAAA